MALRLQRATTAQGLRWVRDGWRVFARKPLAFTALLAIFLFAAVLLLMLPWVGPLLLLAGMPLLTLGFMIATRDALAGRLPTPGVFLQPLARTNPQRGTLVKLGLLYGVATLAIIWGSDLVDGGTFDALQEQMSATTPDPAKVDALMTDPRLSGGLLLRFGLAALLSVPFWHAPALVHWGRQGLAQSLFSSTLAVWACRGAFTSYSLAWAGLIIVFGLIAGLVTSLLGARQLIAFIALPAGFAFSTMFYASQYFIYKDSFSEIDEAAAP